jgi:hypothetical protein
VSPVRPRRVSRWAHDAGVLRQRHQQLRRARAITRRSRPGARAAGAEGP